MSRYSISRKAQQDLDEIWDYIGNRNHNPDAADRLMETMLNHFKMFAKQPGIGELRTDLDDLITGVRSFTVGNYVIYFQPVPNGIRVGRVLHGARDVRPALEG
jgi:toxin ParE1/3/4